MRRFRCPRNAAGRLFLVALLINSECRPFYSVRRAIIPAINVHRFNRRVRRRNNACSCLGGVRARFFGVRPEMGLGSKEREGTCVRGVDHAHFAYRPRLVRPSSLLRSFKLASRDLSRSRLGCCERFRTVTYTYGRFRRGEILTEFFFIGACIQITYDVPIRQQETSLFFGKDILPAKILHLPTISDDPLEFITSLRRISEFFQQIRS